MNKIFFFLFLAVLFISCKKETNSFIPKYQAITGTWKTQAISYDSSGVNITASTPFNRLIINESLEYQICMDIDKPVENGTIIILTQTTDKLEIYFDAKYPSYSSFAGSHLFGFSNTVLFSLTSDEMILKPTYNSFHNNMEIYFTRK
jgi:hypothetical protein